MTIPATRNLPIDLQEQICYVQCGFCTTILLVSVPCISMLKVATVRCGHCTGFLSVNMTKASFIPLQLLASLDDTENKEVCHDELEHPMDSPPAKELDKQSPLTVSSDNDDDEEMIPLNPTINKPPEKRQRAPSAYNRFIKEELQRLKAMDPNITHKEAFSTAARNWAHFPRIQHELERESSCNCKAATMGGEKLTKDQDADVDKVHAQDKVLPEGTLFG